MQQTIESIIIPELDAVDTLPSLQRGSGLTVIQSRFNVASKKRWRWSRGWGNNGFPSKVNSLFRSEHSSSFSLSFFYFFTHVQPPLLPLLFRLSFSTVASFASQYSLLRRMPFLHDYLAGCSARMQRYTWATRCIDDDNVAYRLVRPRACSLRTRRNNFALVYDTVFRRWRRSERYVKFSKVRLPASYRCIVSVAI